MKIQSIRAQLDEYLQELRDEEKAENTIKAYQSDIQGFFNWISDDEHELSRADVVAYKEHLRQTGAKTATINRKIISINKYLKWAGAEDAAGTKQIKTQAKATFEDALSRADYERLLRAAADPPTQARQAGLKSDIQLYMVMETITATGIRISELQYFTVENVKRAKTTGQITVENKGKQRAIPIDKELTKELLNYCNDKGIKSGYIFGTRTGSPISNSQLTKRLKKLAGYARISKSRAHWHNFRHLFSKEYMEMHGRLDELQSILGHSSIQTTTIYTKSSARELAKNTGSLGFVKPLSGNNKRRKVI